MNYENSKIIARNREAYSVKYRTREIVEFAKKIIIEREKYPKDSDPYNCLDDLLLTLCGLNRMGNFVDTLDCESRISKLKEKASDINWQTARIETDPVEHTANVKSINNLFDIAGNNCQGLSWSRNKYGEAANRIRNRGKREDKRRFDKLY
ncbi:MAG: hypothetical protein GY821_18070 [Gammaproteobacteria bacterium]|nr:hypothetical protein [Gammaproteobacteria bacterium]